jgi:hypothetical protein
MRSNQLLRIYNYLVYKIVVGNSLPLFFDITQALRALQVRCGCQFQRLA